MEILVRICYNVSTFMNQYLGQRRIPEKGIQFSEDCREGEREKVELGTAVYTKRCKALYHRAI